MAWYRTISRGTAVKVAELAFAVAVKLCPTAAPKSAYTQTVHGDVVGIDVFGSSGFLFLVILAGWPVPLSDPMGLLRPLLVWSVFVGAL